LTALVCLAQAIESNKRVLKDKYEQAKALAERVNQARAETNRLKAEIERKRVERAMAHIVDGKTASDEADGAAAAGSGSASFAGDSKEEADAEAELKSGMDVQKDEYKRSFAALRDLKAEIEHVQRLLETSRLKMQADFESWFSNSLLRVEQAATASRGGSGGGVGSRASTASGGGDAGDARGYSSGSGGPLLPGQVSLPALPPSYFGGPPGFPAATLMVPFPVAGGVMPPGMAAPPGLFPLQNAAGAVVAASGGTSEPAQTGGSRGGHRAGSSAGSVRSHSSDPSAAGSSAAVVPLLTGNAAADADILAFYKAKEELMRRRGGAAAGGSSSGGSGTGLSAVIADAASLSASISSSRGSSVASVGKR